MKYEEILSQHAEEAAFVWQLREDSVSAPHITLGDLSRHDDRLEAHLDGLRIAGDAGWHRVKSALEEGEAGEIFVASAIAFDSRKEDRILEVVNAGTASPKLSQGLISALGWRPFSQAETRIQSMLNSESASMRQVGIAAMAVHGHYSIHALLKGVEDNDPSPRGCALKSVGKLGAINALPAARENLHSDDEICRFSAAWSVSLLSTDNRAVEVLKSVAHSASPLHEQALQIVLRRMDVSSANAWLAKIAQTPAFKRIAAIGVGILGDPETTPWLIEQFKAPPLARIAGEAFTMITGVDIGAAGLEGEAPEDFEAGPSENPEDDDVAMDADENLPWPDAAKIEAWWNKHRGEFSSGKRHLLGKPINPEWLMEVLKTGRQRQRAAAALELAILQPGKPLFNVRAPGFRQQQWLSGK